VTPAVSQNISETTPATSKPRVLFLVTEDWYFCLHRLSLAKAVQDQGYDIVVATRVREHGAQITAAGFKLLNIKLSRSSWNPFRNLAAIAELVRIYREEKPDIVHQIAMKPIVYGSWAAWIAGVPGVVNAFAGLGFVFEGKEFSKRVLRGITVLLLKSAFARKSTVGMFENTDDLVELKSRGIVTGRSTIVVRGAGVDENLFVPAPEAPGDPVILLASRMVFLKGIGEFVEASRIVRRRGIRARFVLAGRRDPENPTSISEKQLQGWAAEGVVEWWGQRDDMPGAIAEAHIVALPSWTEGLPRALLEAASSARPVVGTDIPGNREIVIDGKNGFMVPLKNPQALAEALIRLIEDPGLRRRMGECGRKMVLESFTERYVFSQVLELYRTMLTRPAAEAGGE
jgi:glycosyltransferase involved in cell wall biosynthesis